jgi:apolipoprotein N-acyltransferase
MSNALARLLTPLFPAVLLVVLGLIIRVRGPQGFVHGVVDWSKIDEPTRRRAGRMTGNLFVAMAALIAGHAVYGYLQGDAAAHSPIVNMIFVGGIVVLVLLMILLLLRLPTTQTKKNGKHDR